MNRDSGRQLMLLHAAAYRYIDGYILSKIRMFERRAKNIRFVDIHGMHGSYTFLLESDNGKVFDFKVHESWLTETNRK